MAAGVPNNEFYLGSTKFMIAGVASLVMGGLVTTVLVNPSDPYFRWTSALVPGIFFLCGVIILLMAIRFRRRPVIWTNADNLYFGKFQVQTIPRRDLRDVAYDSRRGFRFNRADGRAQFFALPINAQDAVQLARQLSGWARR